MRDTTWQSGAYEWVCRATEEKLPALEHVRTEAWSTLWRAQGRETVFWFKENTPSLTPEGPVQATLATLAPDHVDAPVAWDVDRGWLLTRDGGQVLQDRYPDRRGMDRESVRAMLRDYARLQRATVGHAKTLAAAGLRDRSPATAGRTLRDVAAAMAASPRGDPRHITDEEHGRLQASVDLIDEAARHLLDGPVPAAVDHNDLFPRNVFVPRPGQGYRFFDFGESLWSHPFESVVMLTWEIVHQHKLQVADDRLLDLDHPQLHDLFDAYLECWQDFADLATLRGLTAAALQIAPLYRAERWMQILASRSTALDKHGSTPRAWIFDIERPVRL